MLLIIKLDRNCSDEDCMYPLNQGDKGLSGIKGDRGDIGAPGNYIWKLII